MNEPFKRKGYCERKQINWDRGEYFVDGIAFQSAPVLIETYNSGEWLLIKIPGGMVWSGTGQPFRYAPVKYYMIRIKQSNENDAGMTDIFYELGKMNKKERAEAVQKVLEYHNVEVEQ